MDEKKFNDKMRPFRNGKGSYDLIVPKFQKLAESQKSGQSIMSEEHLHRNNLDFSKDVLHLADLGFKQMSVEPVVADRHRAICDQRRGYSTDHGRI